MATVATPEAIARLNALNTLRAPAEQFILGSDGRGNSGAAQGAKYSHTIYRQKLRDIKQLGKDMPVTILNMNPFPLKINGGMLFPETIPACPVGKAYVTYVLDQTRWQARDNGCDAQGSLQMEPVPYVPLALAGEYIREFMQAEYAFGGVMCFVGNEDPATFTADHIVDVPEMSWDNGELFVDINRRVYREIFSQVKSKRDTSTLRVLQLANGWYENDHQRNFLDDTHREMARLAYDQGLIPELPKWVLQANLVQQKQADPCPSCQVVPKAEAILCTNCGQIFNVVEAYRNTRIAYGAQEMDRLSAEEWEEVEKIKAERDKARSAGQKKQAKG